MKLGYFLVEANICVGYIDISTNLRKTLKCGVADNLTGEGLSIIIIMQKVEKIV